MIFATVAFSGLDSSLFFFVRVPTGRYLCAAAVVFCAGVVEVLLLGEVEAQGPVSSNGLPVSANDPWSLVVGDFVVEIFVAVNPGLDLDVSSGLLFFDCWLLPVLRCAHLCFDYRLQN